MSFCFPVDTQPATLIQRCFDVDFGRVSHICTEVDFHLTFHRRCGDIFVSTKRRHFPEFCSLTAENFMENDVICENIVTSSG